MLSPPRHLLSFRWDDSIDAKAQDEDSISGEDTIEGEGNEGCVLGEGGRGVKAWLMSTVEMCLLSTEREVTDTQGFALSLTRLDLLPSGGIWGRATAR